MFRIRTAQNTNSAKKNSLGSVFHKTQVPHKTVEDQDYTKHSTAKKTVSNQDSTKHEYYTKMFRIRTAQSISTAENSLGSGLHGTV